MLGDVEAIAAVETPIERWYVAGPQVRMACERHLRDRLAEGDGSSWLFSADAADVAIGFYEQVLRLPDVLDDEGLPIPFHLEPPLVFIVGSLMGWMGRDGYRRFREGYIEMGKGNAKTPLLAGLGLFGLSMDGESAPEIYAAATTRDQAQIMFRDAVRQAECSDDSLSSQLKVSGGDTPNNISCGLGFFRPFSRDQGVKSGVRPSMALIDEVHEHPTADVINKLKAGFKHRRQPLAVMITNSGFDRTSICYQMHQHADRVLNGYVSDDRLFLYVCSVDEGEDPLTDESCWIKTNPMLGVTITLEYLRRQVENARNIPSELNTVLRLNFCVWTNQRERAIDMAQWDRCQAVVSDDELADAPCYGALDLGQSDDFSAWVRMWTLHDGRLAVKCRFWVPEAAFTKYPNRPYDEWRRLGLLEVTDGDCVDYGVIEEAIEQDCTAASILSVTYDPMHAKQMAQNLQGRGITVVSIGQGWQLSEATKRLFDLISQGVLCCEDNKILSVMASNFVIRHGSHQQIRPDKEAASEKIDGMVALTMGIDTGVVRNPIHGHSVYDTHGVEVLSEYS